MSDKTMPAAPNGIIAIWNLLTSGNQFYRAAGILLLKEYASNLTAHGKGELASRIVQEFRDNDPRRPFRPKGDNWTLKP